MIITNLEYVDIISDLNKIAGGLVDIPSIPDFPSTGGIKEAIENIESEVEQIVEDLIPNI